MARKAAAVERSEPAFVLAHEVATGFRMFWQYGGSIKVPEAEQMTVETLVPYLLAEIQALVLQTCKLLAEAAYGYELEGDIPLCRLYGVDLKAVKKAIRDEEKAKKSSS